MLYADSSLETHQRSRGSRQPGAPAMAKLTSRFSWEVLQAKASHTAGVYTFSDCNCGSIDNYLGSRGPITTHQLDSVILKHMELRPKNFGAWQALRLAIISTIAGSEDTDGPNIPAKHVQTDISRLHL